MTKQEMLEMLKDPEVAKALSATADKEDELESLLKGIDISDEDTLESLSKKHQGQISKLVSYFNTKLEEVETRAVEKATAPAKEKADQEINAFAKENPGMQNPEVIEMMQPLYDKGKPLAECYSAACRALELDPTTGKAPEASEEAAKGEPAKDDKKVGGAKDKKTSMRSDIRDDVDLEADNDDKKDDGPVSIRDAVSANINTLIAKKGNPFEQKDDI